MAANRPSQPNVRSARAIEERVKRGKERERERKRDEKEKRVSLSVVGDYVCVPPTAIKPRNIDTIFALCIQTGFRLRTNQKRRISTYSVASGRYLLRVTNPIVPPIILHQENDIIRIEK